MHDKPWVLSPQALATAYVVDLDAGLSDTEAAARLKKYGYNEIPREQHFKPLIIFIRQWLQPLTLLLVVAGIASVLVGEATDAIAIFAAAMVSVVAGLAQEGKTARVFDQVSAAHTVDAVVVRNGQRMKIPSFELVPGDIVILGSGDAVAADIRAFAASDLSVNEAILTGEWAPVSRTAAELSESTPAIDRNNIVWSGTAIASGSGKGVVIATGMHTQFGKIAQTARANAGTTTPLEKSVRQLALRIAIGAGIAVLVLMVLGVMRGESLATILLIAIAVGVSVIPEGLPVAVTVVLAGAMERILRRGGLVKSLRAAETLGATTVILTDKTGTLTEGRMAVAGYASVCSLLGEGLSSVQNDNREILTAALLASEAFFDEHAGQKTAVGRPVELAVLHAAAESGIHAAELERTGHRRLDFIKFDSARRFAASLNEHPVDGIRLYVSGAPETLLSIAKVVLAGSETRPMDARVLKAFMDFQHAESSAGRRLIGVGYVPTTHVRIGSTIHAGMLPEGLVFAGLLSLDDPVRADAPQMVAAARNAGVRVVMATGDFAETARSIAKQAGIIEEDGHVVTGHDMETMSDEQLIAALMNHTVFARVLPDQKLRMALLLRSRGEVVAMTGDGVNDAPALAAADIGVAVGNGAAAAKDAADLILLHNNFGVITTAVAEGRRAFANLRKTILYLLSSGFSEIMVVGGALLAGGPLPILPAQILWANIIEEGIMSFPFAAEPLSKDALRKPPRTKADRALIPQTGWMLIAASSLVVGTLLLAIYVYLLVNAVSHEMLRSVMFIAMSLDPLFLLFSLKEPDKPLWRISFFKNPFLLLSAGISILVLFAAFFIPPLAKLLSLERVPYEYVLLVVGGGLTSVVGIEGVKWMLRHKMNGW